MAPRDRIFLSEHVREMEIGAFQKERGRRQRVRFAVWLDVAPGEAHGAREDDVDAVLSYDTILDAIDAEQGAGRVDLLETLAERLAARLLAHPRAARARIRLEKLDLGPHVLGVEIARDRAEVPASAPPPPPAPRIVLLGAGMLDDAALPALLDGLARGTPSILCAAPDFHVPRADHPLAQRRIDLLAMEQAAWRLAARDARCTVLDSRTEIDWALRRAAEAGGGLMGWSPPRLALGTPGAPREAHPLALARWLASLLGAAELLVLGDAEAPGAPLAIERHRSGAAA